MQPGRLKNRILFQRRTIEKDSFGQSVERWVDDVTLWGAITDQTGREFNLSQTEKSITNCTITIRKYKNISITPDMRAFHNGIFYDIKAVLMNEAQTYLQLPCQKGARYD
jgi:SPP1 family predicted phage head-tail adaptor